jgi:hypothetical protein
MPHARRGGASCRAAVASPDMANPASLLLAQLRAWQSPQKTADDVRKTGDTETWVRHRLAVRHLAAIEEVLDEMAAQGRSGINLYQQMMVSWTQAVFAWPHGWGTPRSGQIDGTALQHLETLAGRLDDHIPTATADGLNSTKAFAGKVTNTLAGDDSIPADLKAHLRQLVDQLLWCIERYDITGDFELKLAIERLLMTAGVAGQQSSNGGGWTRVVRGFKSPFAVQTAAGLTSGAMLMLMHGSL